MKLPTSTKILDKDGNKWGFISEKSGGILGTLVRLILRNRRPMNIVIWDKEKKEVLHMKRPFYLFRSKITVAHNHRILGNVRKRFSILRAYYDIIRNSGKKIGLIKSEHGSRQYSIINPGGSSIGTINKKMSGLRQEILTDADNFFVGFPSAWSSEDKALVLAAAISIDMDFYEKSSSGNRF